MSARLRGGGTNTHVNDCDTFAHMPEGERLVMWDSINVEVDSAEDIVYVADTLYSKIHVFSFTGDYMGQLTDSMNALLSPLAMALRTGPLPSLSSVSRV